MKIVLDTNVIVSGLLSVHGPCAQIIDRMLEGDFQICVDSRILVEYEEVLSRPKFPIPSGMRQDILDFIRHHAERVAAPPIAAKLPDEWDRPFLEVALEARAILVTGNLRHFPKRSRKGVTVISPREFVDVLAG